jgi:hypothetical protein
MLDSSAFIFAPARKRATVNNPIVGASVYEIYETRIVYSSELSDTLEVCVTSSFRILLWHVLALTWRRVLSSDFPVYILHYVKKQINRIY